MKHKLLAAAGVLAAMAIGAVALLYKSAVNDDAAQVIAMHVAELTRQNGGKLPAAATIAGEIAALIDASVIHGSVTDSSATNVWGHPFEVEVLPGGAVRCRSPGLFRVVGSSEYTADPP